MESFKDYSIRENAKKDLVAHIKKDNSKFSDWYCGVTENVKTRLKQHESKFAVKLPYSIECHSVESAVAVEKSMHIKKCDGYKRFGPGGATDDSTHVYVFKKK